MEKNKNHNYIIWAIIIVMIVIVSVFFMSKSASAPINYDDFAKCTASNGFTLYGAAWCGHCAAQKALFGEAFQHVNYVECPENIDLCKERGILNYPTWQDETGRKYEGEQSLKTLSEITNCTLPE